MRARTRTHGRTRVPLHRGREESGEERKGEEGGGRQGEEEGEEGGGVEVAVGVVVAVTVVAAVANDVQPLSCDGCATAMRLLRALFMLQLIGTRMGAMAVGCTSHSTHLVSIEPGPGLGC